MRGIDCIVGKRIDCKPAQRDRLPARQPSQGVQPDLVGGRLGHLMVSQRSDGLFLAPWGDPSQMELADDVYDQHQPQVTELSLQYRLTEDDRSLLLSALPLLPPLHYPISEVEADTFIEAWSNLPNRPEWQPVLITASTIEWQKEHQNTVARTHRQQLQGEIDRGRIVAVNAEHVRVERLTLGCSISRAQAIEYLDRIGIAHCDGSADDDPTDRLSRGAELFVQTVDDNQSRVGKPKLSDKERQEMIRLSMDLEEKGVVAFRKPIAKRFGVSEKTVYNEVTKAKKAEKDRKGSAIPIDKLLISKHE